MLLVVAVALRDADGRVLMQRRPAGRAHPGLWEFPGGKVDAGEHPEAALARELREELDIDVPLQALVPIGFSTVADAGSGWLLMLLYGCPVWQGTPLPKHADALRWVAAKDLAAMLMPPADIPLIPAVTSYLSDVSG